MPTEKNTTKTTTVTTHRSPVQRVARILLKTILFLLLFVVVVVLLLLTPPGQQFATNKLETYLGSKLKTRVEIGKIRIGLPRLVVAENVYIEDRTHDTLIAGGSIRLNIALFRLFSNEVAIKDVQLENITAKVKRVLPDTVYNFQFVLDAFASEQKKDADTAAAPVMKFEVNNVSMKNCHVVYKDALTGNDMDAWIASAHTKIDSLDPYQMKFSIADFDVSGLRVRYYQTRPLTAPAVNATDPKATAAVIPQIRIGQARLRDSYIDYGNETSAFYTQLKIGDVQLRGRNIDLDKQVLHLASLRLDRNDFVIRLGRKQGARDVKAAVAKSTDEAVKQDWMVRVDAIDLNGNRIRYDDENSPRHASGIDFAHFDGQDMNLSVRNLVLNKDSIAANIARASLREKSGFVLNELSGDLLYASNVAYVRNLSLRTPGTSLQRSAELRYASQEALVKNFANTFFDVDVRNSRIQVKDILAFAPQLRSNAAFANPNAVWTVNLQGSGTMNKLNIAALQFNGLRNTQIDASGTLAGLSNPNSGSGTFRIRRLHTSQSDIALLTGQRLDNAQMDLPETFNISGTVSGNMNSVSTNLAMATDYGNVDLDGTFRNITNPAKLSYDVRSLRTRTLRLDKILRGKVPVGALSGNFRVSGSGTTPATMKATFSGSVPSIVYNKYNYKNIRLDGSVNGSNFSVKTDIRDPNIDLNLTAKGNYETMRMHVSGFIDSVKTQPLGFTTQPLTFRGKLDAQVNEMTMDYLDANVLLTQALFVSGTTRAPIDSLSLVAGHSGSDQFMRLRSDFANADLNGRYRFSDLGYIIQNNIQPYFGVGDRYKAQAVQPYDITFRLDAENAPIFQALVPGLNFNQPLHAEGTLATGRGLNAQVTAPDLAFGTNAISGLNLTVTTTPQGLQLTGDLSRLSNGSTFNIFNSRLTATVNNNVIDFNLGVNDKGNVPKYRLGGLLTQPTPGSYTLSLRPDSLLLNYQTWSIAAGNQLIVTPNSIGATNFVLSRDGQSLALNSTAGVGSPLNVQFTNFRIGTITGFLRADSLLADGTINGGATFRNLPKNPLFTSDLTIADLSFQRDTIGNVALRVNNANGDRYIADINVTGRGNDLALTGTMTPQAGGPIGLDLNLDVRALQLQSLRGALASFITDASGTITGGARIQGTTAAPKVAGNLRFNNTSISTVALGGPLRIDNEELRVTENGFRFDNFTIRDSASNAMNLNGTVATTNFINYKFDLDVTARNFRALNTQKKNNSLYYGQLFMNTNLHVGGTEAAPVVDGNIAVNDGTAFTIVVPQRAPGVVEREGVVEFVDFSNPGVDSFFLASVDTLNTTEVRGMDVSVNIDISKEASFNVIVDVAQGDLLNLKGTGNLNAGVDPSGKITLTGSYVIDEGAYQFSLNFLRRRFTVDRGSKITWLGEPTSAQLDVTGRYEANTAPLDLVEQQVPEQTQRNYYLQKLPFQILLYLRGEMLKPDLSFDIQLPNDRNYNVAGDVVSLVNTRLAQLRQEPSELNKQVFAVLLLNRFVGDNPFASSGGGFNAGSFARTSVSKLLTEQLNNLASGLISGVDLNFDVTSSDDYTTGDRRARTDLNVGLSKRLLNDRLQVTVGSNFQLEGPQQSNQSSNNIAGNVQVNYQLSRDGRYMLRFYRRNEYEGIVDGYVIETGLSFVLQVDYNRLREVFQSRKTRREIRQRERAKEKEQEQQQPQQPVQSQPATPAASTPAPASEEEPEQE